MTVPLWFYCYYIRGLKWDVWVILRRRGSVYITALYDVGFCHRFRYYKTSRNREGDRPYHSLLVSFGRLRVEQGVVCRWGGTTVVTRQNKSPTDSLTKDRVNLGFTTFFDIVVNIWSYVIRLLYSCSLVVTQTLQSPSLVSFILYHPSTYGSGLTLVLV